MNLQKTIWVKLGHGKCVSYALSLICNEKNHRTSWTIGSRTLAFYRDRKQMSTINIQNQHTEIKYKCIKSQVKMYSSLYLTKSINKYQSRHSRYHPSQSVPGSKMFETVVFQPFLDVRPFPFVDVFRRSLWCLFWTLRCLGNRCCSRCLHVFILAVCYRSRCHRVEIR